MCEEESVISVHQQRGVNGPILGDSQPLKRWRGLAVKVELMRNRRNVVRSNMVWEHGCGRARARDEGRIRPLLLYMFDFLWVTPSLEAGRLLVLVCFTDNQLLHS